MSDETNPDSIAAFQHLPLDRYQRRVLGVLVEKAKTTPDGYPMTVNALVNGCNQKSNRSPQMQIDADEVQAALDELRAMGAVMELQGTGRAVKYRHNAYEWFGVSGGQAAVLIELILRGPQTKGELRSRASRMEKLPDLDAVTVALDGLIQKKLVRAFSQPGRGQTFGHTLYDDREMEKLLVAAAGNQSTAPAAAPSRPAAPAQASAAQTSGTPAKETPVAGVSQEEFDALKERVERLEQQLDSLLH